jgi:hypothetical protein
VFNLVSSQIPIDVAVEMASKYVSSDMAVSSEVLDRLHKIQERTDRMDEQRFKAEMAQQKASVEATQANAERMKEGEASGGDGSGQKGVVKPKEASKEKLTKGRSPAEEQREKALSDKEEKGYSRLEQHMHERARLGTSKRKEAKSKAENKTTKG